MKKLIKKLIFLFFLFILNIEIYAGQLASLYVGNPYMDMGKSTFTEIEKVLTQFEHYSNLDYLGRCGIAYANICKEIMPTTPRKSIGMIKPTGWQSPLPKYDFIDGKYLYNRCHLIAYELAGENANEKNLVTGTRYMNIEGMLPFENKVANHVKATNHHVLYRSTPFFEGDNLLCEGVQIEAYCVEEHGESIDFNVFCFNVQPNIIIDYATGKDLTNIVNDANSKQVEKANVKEQNLTNIVNDANSKPQITNEISSSYILNKRSKKIHIPSCKGVKSMSEKNKIYSNDDIANLLEQGYTICGICKAGTK